MGEDVSWIYIPGILFDNCIVQSYLYRCTSVRCDFVIPCNYRILYINQISLLIVRYLLSDYYFAMIDIVIISVRGTGLEVVQNRQLLEIKSQKCMFY